ncbi:zinc-binding dehydrogenase [Paenibacillus sp. P36]|uniref:zinc-binding dehydrogenase n=1 Tax=Paenibacillus sp. P36 TaxID=3342538 RepID=UPI0038B3D3CA
MESCRTVIFPEAYQVEWKQSPLPELDENQLLVKTAFSLISPGTELALYTGTHTGLLNPGNTWAKYPFTPGYAVVGSVEAVGANITDFQVGQRVFAMGAHASHNVITYTPDSRSVFVLPDDLPGERAVFARLAGISATALQQAQVRLGDKTVVIGMGLIGVFAAQLFALQGADVLGVDTVPGRLQAARACKIANVYQSDPHTALHSQLTGLLGDGKGNSDRADIVIEATGVPEMANEAMEMVRQLGQVVLLGSPRGPIQMKTYDHIHVKGITLTGAHEGLQTIDGEEGRTRMLRYALHLIHTGQLTVDPLLTHVLPAREARQAYELLIHAKETTLGVILDWREETRSNE